MPTTRCSSLRSTLAPSRAVTAALTLSALLFGAGCAAPGPRDDTSSGLIDVVDVSYTVQSGDRLSDIALEITGDMSLWEEIAASNGIEDPRFLRAGSVLRIPAELIPGYADGLAARESVGERRDESIAARESGPVESEPVDARTAVTSGLAVRRAAPVELSPVDVNRRFELSPIDQRATPERPNDGSSDERGASVDPVGIGPTGARRIKVVGSYFPKGVYAQPATYSKLLMRVAPGTLFELERKVGDWYGVVTSEGIGYLRDSDGRVVDGERTASLGA